EDDRYGKGRTAASAVAKRPEGRTTGLIFFQDLHYPSHLSVVQTNLYTPGMECRRGEDVFYDPFCGLAASLVLFQDNGYGKPWINVFSVLSVHSHWIFNNAKVRKKAGDFLEM